MIVCSHVTVRKSTEIPCACPVFPKGGIAQHHNLDTGRETAKTQSMSVTSGIPRLLLEGYLGCFWLLAIRSKAVQVFL